MNTDMIELSLVISVYQCPQWFKKILATAFKAPGMYDEKAWAGRK
jgi:hypothetical protein